MNILITTIIAMLRRLATQQVMELLIIRLIDAAVESNKTKWGNAEEIWEDLRINLGHRRPNRD